MCIVYTYFRVPEPQGRSFAELDLLFERHVPARKFASTDVDVFVETVDGNVIHQYEEKLDIAHAENSGAATQWGILQAGGTGGKSLPV